MSKYSLFILLSACLLLFRAPAHSAPRFDQGDRVCVYKDHDFHGRESCFQPGDQVADLKDIDLASIRVYGRARVVLYEDKNFKGHSMEFGADVPDLKRVTIEGSKRWHDHVGSLRVTPGP